MIIKYSLLRGHPNIIQPLSMIKAKTSALPSAHKEDSNSSINNMINANLQDLFLLFLAHILHSKTVLDNVYLFFLLL